MIVGRGWDRMIRAICNDLYEMGARLYLIWINLLIRLLPRVLTVTFSWATYNGIDDPCYIGPVIGGSVSGRPFGLPRVQRSSVIVCLF